MEARSQSVFEKSAQMLDFFRGNIAGGNDKGLLRVGIYQKTAGQFEYRRQVREVAADFEFAFGDFEGNHTVAKSGNIVNIQEIVGRFYVLGDLLFRTGKEEKDPDEVRAGEEEENRFHGQNFVDSQNNIDKTGGNHDNRGAKKIALLHEKCIIERLTIIFNGDAKTQFQRTHNTFLSSVKWIKGGAIHSPAFSWFKYSSNQP
ncbi:MAG: hypothetical protein IKD01_01925 [Oscillospiraceae bacterium]|nr:hypothetical protein [Oscillospiraceae bacterium]